MNNLRKIVVVMTPERYQDIDRREYLGLPLQFITLKIEPKKSLQTLWIQTITEYPGMECLRDVVLEFVEPKREHPPP
jgi:hypothetical protein